MDCNQFGVVIRNDKDGKLAKAANYVAKGNSQKRDILSTYLNSEDFWKYCKQDAEVLKQESLKGVIESFNDIPGNTLQRLLKEYYLKHHTSVYNTSTVKQGLMLNGFTSATARSLAADHCADLIRETTETIREENKGKAKEDRLSEEDILKRVANIIQKRFYTSVGNSLFKIMEEEHSADIDKVKKLNKELKDKENKYNELFDEYDNTEDENRLDELDNEINTVEEEIEKLKAKRYALYQTLIDKYGDVRHKNYANLYALIKRGEGRGAWFNYVFNNPKLTSYRKEFEQLLESDKLVDENWIDDEDAVNIEVENDYETTKNWEGATSKTFEKMVASGLRLYLDSLYKLAQPITRQNQNPIYDDNNELGVPTTMSANFIINQIDKIANFNSVTEFINSIEEHAKVIPELYGLTKLVQDMKNDTTFANYVFTQLNNVNTHKTMVIMGEDGKIKFINSNREANAITALYNKLFNSAKNNRGYFDITDKDVLSLLIARYKNLSQSTFDITADLEDGVAQQSDKVIYDIMYKYFPNLSKNAITSYLYAKGKSMENHKQLLNHLLTLLNRLEVVVDQFNEEQERFNNGYEENGKKVLGYREWAKSNGRLDEAPKFNYDHINFEELNLPIIAIAKAIIDYNIVKTELNSMNAEGNLASDLLDNNYISNWFKQLQYGNTENAYAGLEKLKEFISKGHQYDKVPLFFGVKDSKGRTIQEGLFIRNADNTISINPNAKNILNYSLFDGAKDEDGYNTAMYATMSKTDYFITQLIAFNQPLGFDGLLGQKEGELAKKYCNVFMRTPSDAPKNFVIQTLKYSTNDLFSSDLKSKNDYRDSVKSRINSYNFNNDYDLSLDSKQSKRNALSKNQEENIIEIYNLLTKEIEDFNYDERYFIEDAKTGKILVPIVFNGEKITEDFVIYLEGDKKQGTSYNIIENVKIKEIYAPFGKTPDAFYTEALNEYIAEEGINNGSIKQNINIDNVAFGAFRDHLINDMITFVDQLSNVFELVNGKWVTKKDTKGLIDRAHYNVTYDEKGNPQYIVQGKYLDNKQQKVNPNAGKLSGNFFNSIKLFESNGYNVLDELMNGLSLYGGGNKVFSKTRSEGLTLNLNNAPFIRVDGNRFKLVITEELNNLFNNIVTNWVSNFRTEVLKEAANYSTVIQNQFSNNEIIEAIFNSAIMNMNFDYMFEGGSVFYKNARDFLKRAKEVQAGGKSYANFDLNDSIGGPLKNILDNTGNPREILINGSSYETPRKEGNTYNTKGKLIARNGFRAVTITNTVRGSSNAGVIKKDLINALSKEMDVELATKIADEIASNYYGDTKVNDAQSYITFEEFIARRDADGTLKEYEDLIQQILDVRNGIKKLHEIDLKGISSRIQIQKNFYYDIQFDTETRTYYPRQIKNAEFVLIPELIVGTDLEKLYNIMRSHDIGQVNTAETSKAAKKNVLTFWDNNGQINEQAFVEALEDRNEAAIENYYYRYLYKQQEVPEHMKEQTNKAGIQIMKKIIDNAPAELDGAVNKFFSNYVANIKSDFSLLLNRLGWKVVDGVIVNANGSTDLDFKEFYKTAKHEAQRLGLDSNFIEFLEPDPDTGRPRMPNYMNNVSSKLESIAQSIFNSSITRQTLPGWHAAQVTAVGHGAKVLDSTGKFRELSYHPEVVDENGNVKVEAYAEVLIPRWSNLIPKGATEEETAKILKQMETEGIDIHIGYRIPTEGKQSICVLKVVGFLDDVYGSTIMVPDEWVTQTGSDFDVDSVYGICYKFFKDRNGNLRKIEYDNDESEAGYQRRYIRHINKLIDEKVEQEKLNRAEVKESFKSLKHRLKEELGLTDNSEEFQELFKESRALFDQLGREDKVKVYDINERLAGDSFIIERYESVAYTFKELAAKTENKELKELYQNFSNISFDIASFIKATRDEQSLFNEEFASNVGKTLRKRQLEKFFNEVKKVAKEQGLVSYNEFKTWDIEDQQSRDARTNAMLDVMIEIMEHPSSKEENYSGSHFRDLITAKQTADELRGANKVKTSPYNPFTQLQFMEDARSGASLKAFSVVRDTFCSVNNRVKSVLSKSNEIVAEYDLTNPKYNLELILKAYGEDVTVDKDRKVAIVRHKRFGWSNTNRNVVGKLITAYSSQTTAHILDAIKDGSIFNEDMYTFGTFKTLIDVGIDYDTAISFLMQPGITRIVEANRRVNSVYINDRRDPIEAAIKEIAQELDITINDRPINEYTDIQKVLNVLTYNDRVQNAFKQLFGVELGVQNHLKSLSIPLNLSMLQNRLKSSEIINNSELSEEDKKYQDAAFDLAMIMFFNKVHATTESIEKLARCSNPDKFGAKQTIRETRTKVNEIFSYSQYGDKAPDAANVLLAKDDNGNYESLMKVLFGIEEKADGTKTINPKKSKYPSLAAFLAYSTIPSVQTNKQLFITENDAFAEILDVVQDKLGVVFSNIVYKEYKQYMISDLYYKVPILNSPVTVNKQGCVVFDQDRILEYEEDGQYYYNAERTRIFGYDITQSTNFNVNDINKPTKDELAKFNKLTPAQKVIWIQQHFPDGQGIFEFLHINIYNQKELKEKGISPATIRFSDQVDNIEELFRIFDNSYFNSNPFCKLAAVDLIKYAFLVEGYRFKKGGLSKLITNKAIYSSVNDYGLDIIDVLNKEIYLYSNTSEARSEQFIDKFIRSHSDIVKHVKLKKIPKHKSKEGDKAKVNRYKHPTQVFIDCSKGYDGMVYIPYPSEKDESTKELLSYLDIQDVSSPKEYIKITRPGDNKGAVLYKIKRKDAGVYLIPLNTLEKNETCDYSFNKKNIKFKDVAYYNELIDYLTEGTTINQIEDQEYIEILRKENTIVPFKRTAFNEAMENIDLFQRLLSTGSEREKGAISSFISKYETWLSKDATTRGKHAIVYIDSPVIRELIKYGKPIIQNIIINDTPVTVKIMNVVADTTLRKAIKEISENGSKANEKVLEKVKPEYKTALDDIVKAKAFGRQYLYKILPVIDAQTKTEIENRAEQAKTTAKQELASITSDIEGVTSIVEHEKDSIEDIATSIYNNIDSRYKRYRDIQAEDFVKRMSMKGLDIQNNKSIHDNKRNIYVGAAEYYREYANALMDRMMKFSTSTGEVFSINDKQLYNHLTKHPEDYELLVQTLLEAKTFGDHFYDIFNLDISSEDEETKKAINDIRKAINLIRNSNLLYGTKEKPGAIELFFNDYIANNFADNPLVRRGLIELREQFGDNDWFDLYIADTGEATNKQIQVIYKYVNSILNAAAKINAPQNVKNFTEQFDSIMNESEAFNWDNIIDKEGRLIRPYSNKWIEDRDFHINAVREAKNNYGLDSHEYIKAKLARDKWYAENVEQPVVKEYYDELNTLIENTYNSIPDLYKEYMKLVRERYDISINGRALTKEERDKRRELNERIAQLTSQVNDDFSPKTDEEIFKANILKNFIEKKHEINERYFDYKESEVFKASLTRYLKIIERYDAANPYENISEKLLNDDYREAYEWIQQNAHYSIDKESKEKILKAFSKVNRSNTESKNVKIREIIKLANAYDEFGRIDPRKLSPEDIAEIKKLHERKFAGYDNALGEAMLIKEIPAGLPVYKSSFYQKLKGPNEKDKEVEKKRHAIIKEINALLSRGIETNGHISSKLLFENLTIDELKELRRLYFELSDIKSKRQPKSYYTQLFKNVKFRTNDEAFNRELLYAETQLKGTNKYNLWVNIFVQLDENGIPQIDKDGNYVPSDNLFGYIEAADQSLIDTDKTEARRLIENNVENVPTEYYYEAMNKATEEGRFKEWFDTNHVYNQYTHKFEPLSIWTIQKINPGNGLNGKYSYVPTFENIETKVKDDYRNKEYRPGQINYRPNKSENGYDHSSYANRNKLTNKERKMVKLFEDVFDQFVLDYGGKKFIEEGFMPRRAKYKLDARWAFKQVIGSLGLEFRNTNEQTWHENFDYVHDFNIQHDMLNLIKTKGYQQLPEKPERGLTQNEEDYQKDIENWKKETDRIKAENLKLDNELLDRDWKSVMQDFIEKATVIQAKEKVKNTIYLLLEDLKENDAYAISAVSGKVKTNRDRSTRDEIVYAKTPQTRFIETVKNWGRRIIFNEFKRKSKYSKYADLLQNMTSAKYMIFNVTGGIANIGTGMANIFNEVFAKEYFDMKTFREAQNRYVFNSLSMIADMYSPTTQNLSVAITKFFDVVDFDAFTERRPNETATEYVRRIRDGLYSMQSGGEHYMQNTVLFAMLKSHRIFDDPIDGTKKVGNFNDYTWKVEAETLMSLLSSNPELSAYYKTFLKEINRDKSELKKYDEFRRDLNEEFLRELGDKELINKYIELRDENIKKAKIEFEKNPLLEEQFILKDGVAQIVDPELLTERMWGEFRERVKSVNKKIHGVYDKIGAAYIESNWWGGLVMQYHKHIYPGIMKRYRVKGYYNETRGTIERGSYITLANYLATEFKDIRKNVNKRVNQDNENVALASISEIIKSIVDTALNLGMNYKLLPEWERHNMKRCLGDLQGVVSAFLIAICLHMMTDDDEIKDSEALSTMLYLADRLNTEASMYTPWGLYTEASTLWSSPIAGQNSIKDLLKAASYGVKALTDEEFSMTYTTGLYKGQNKLQVLLYRNTPIWRTYQRLSHMSKNNSYYRINETALNIKAAKNIADTIVPD